MAYTEKRTISYGQNVKNSFSGIGTGFLLFCGATALLWWNEGRAVKTTKALEEGQSVSVHVENISTVDPQYDGMLIHANGKAETTDILTDGTFGISINAIKLSRDVEYYQWVESSHTEKKEKVGGATEEITTYTYNREWTSRPIDSNSFKDPDYQGRNSVLTTFEEQDYAASNVSFGAYQLSATQINSISGSQNLNVELSPEVFEELNNGLQKVVGYQYANSQLVNVSGNTIYLGANPSSPAIGDVRISFTYVPQKDISIISKVNGNTFVPYTAKNGYHVNMLESGTRSMEEMYQSAHESNTIMTWILRILGIVLVCAGLKMMFAILGTLLKVLPFLQTIVNWGVGFFCNIIGFCWSLIIIALAWIFYRPLVGIILLAIVGGLIYYFYTKGKGKKPADVEPVAPQA